MYQLHSIKVVYRISNRMDMSAQMELLQIISLYLQDLSKPVDAYAYGSYPAALDLAG